MFTQAQTPYRPSVRTSICARVKVCTCIQARACMYVCVRACVRVRACICTFCVSVLVYASRFEHVYARLVRAPDQFIHYF